MLIATMHRSCTTIQYFPTLYSLPTPNPNELTVLAPNQSLLTGNEVQSSTVVNGRRLLVKFTRAPSGV